MWLCLLRPTGWNDPTYRWGSCWPNNLHWLEAVNGWWLSVIVLCTVHLEWTLTLQRYLGNIDFLPSHSFFIYLFFPALLPFLSRWWWSVPAPAASLDYLSHLRRPQDTSGGGAAWTGGGSRLLMRKDQDGAAGAELLHLDLLEESIWIQDNAVQQWRSS